MSKVSDADQVVRRPAPIAREESYATIFHRAIVDPESLTAEEHARLDPADKRLIIAALDREIAKADAQLAGLEVREPRIGGKRRRELLASARAGGLRYSELSSDELRAIENTPGLEDEIWEAMP